MNVNGGTFTITGAAVASAQTLGAVTFGVALPSGFVGLNPTQTGLGASTINLSSGAGGLTVNLGAISHVTGGTANVVLPALGTVTTSGAAIGGIANGFTTTSAGTTWLAQDGGGVLTALASYGNDSYGAGTNTDVVTGSVAPFNGMGEAPEGRPLLRHGQARVLACRRRLKSVLTSIKSLRRLLQRAFQCWWSERSLTTFA